MHKNVGRHEVDFVGGRVLGPGEQAELTREELAHEGTKRMVEEGVLLDISGTKSATGKES